MERNVSIEAPRKILASANQKLRFENFKGIK